jgi:hypothetical protein
MASDTYQRNLARFEATVRERTDEFKRLEQAHARTLCELGRVDGVAAAAKVEAADAMAEAAAAREEIAAVKEEIQTMKRLTTLREHVNIMERAWVGYIWPGAVEIGLGSIHQLREFINYYHKLQQTSEAAQAPEKQALPKVPPKHATLCAVDAWNKLTREEHDAIKQRLIEAGPEWLTTDLKALKDRPNKQNHNVSFKLEEAKAEAKKFLDVAHYEMLERVVAHNTNVMSLLRQAQEAKVQQREWPESPLNCNTQSSLFLPGRQASAERRDNGVAAALSKPSRKRKAE